MLELSIFVYWGSLLHCGVKVWFWARNWTEIRLENGEGVGLLLAELPIKVTDIKGEAGGSSERVK